MMDGRVKTLHPKIHGGLLGIRGNPEHEAAMLAHGIAAIDLLVVTLYPFEETLKRIASQSKNFEEKKGKAKKAATTSKDKDKDKDNDGKSKKAAADNKTDNKKSTKDKDKDKDKDKQQGTTTTAPQGDKNAQPKNYCGRPS